ncbi:MAG: GNAT family N-acetyltransferase [Betaproteobacteria bacterium]|nr:GNAT family N-acetyltransferase [Betaproteobacteria bacterium]
MSSRPTDGEMPAPFARHADAGQLVIRPFRRDDASAFRALNLAWIERYFRVEPLDLRHLDHPEEHFLSPGGAIWIAESQGSVIGVCGLLHHGDGVYEISKMAVREGLQGFGIGRRLLRAVIEHARTLGARRLEIISNTVLGPAVRLYRSEGFSEVPLTSDAYARGNIALMMTLDT